MFGLPRLGRPALPALRLVTSAWLLSACTVGPNFRPPAAPAAGFSPAPLPTSIEGAATLGGGPQALKLGADIAGDWWTLFHSDKLNALIARALQANPTLAAAQAALRAANETARAQQGSLFPTVSAGGSATRQRISAAQSGGVTVGSQTSTSGGAATSIPAYTLYGASVSVSYAPDIWGGVRRAVEQQEALADYQRFVLEASYLTLTSNIVTAAVGEASLRAQIAATEQVVQADQDGLRIVNAQLQLGGGTRADVLQQQAVLQTTLATLPPLRSQLAQQRNLLATYLGAYPDQPMAPDFELGDLQLPHLLPVSLASALVEQRPDIQQSAALLHAQTAAIGIATANLLPQISLSGSYGSDALTIGKLFSPGTAVYSLAAQLTQTLFAGGTLVHRRRAAIAGAEQALAQYQSTVIAAFANVSDALLALQYDAATLQVALAAAKAANQSLALLKLQYGAGAVTYLSVLTAEQTDENALISLARAQATRFADTAALFQALGGGWWNRTDVARSVSQCCGVFQ